MFLNNPFFRNVAYFPKIQFYICPGANRKKFFKKHLTNRKKCDIITTEGKGKEVSPNDQIRRASPP